MKDFDSIEEILVDGPPDVTLNSALAPPTSHQYNILSAQAIRIYHSILEYFY